MWDCPPLWLGRTSREEGLLCGGHREEGHHGHLRLRKVCFLWLAASEWRLEFGMSAEWHHMPLRPSRGSQPFHYEDSSFSPSLPEVFTRKVDLGRLRFCMLFFVRSQILKIILISKYQASIRFAVWSFGTWPFICGQASSGYISAQWWLFYLWSWPHFSLDKHCLEELVPIKCFLPPAPDWNAALGWAPASRLPRGGWTSAVGETFPGQFLMDKGAVRSGTTIGVWCWRSCYLSSFSEGNRRNKTQTLGTGGLGVS